jgi:hypothetical protein
MKPKQATRQSEIKHGVCGAGYAIINFGIARFTFYLSAVLSG